MTRMLLVGLACLAVANAHGAGDVVAPVMAVVLFPGGATVTRSAAVTPTMRRIEITGLPAGFDIQTLRAEADAGIRIGQIVIQDAGDTEAVNPAEAVLNDKIQAFRDQDAALDAESRAADIVRAYLERFGGNDTANEHTRTAVDAKTLAGLIDTLGRGANEALARMQRIAVQRREIGKKVDALQRDLARMRTGSTDRRTLTVNFLAERAGALRVSYQVPQAGWKPAYRAALDGENSRVSLERLATVSQKTGEDWNNVTLRLSTNQPRLSPQAPEPQPWLLSYVPPRPTGDAVFAAAAAPAPAPAFAPRMKEGGGAGYQPPSFETQSTYATEFEVPSRVSLASDGREITVPLSTQTLPVKQRLRVAPRLDKTAIVTAEAERPDGVWPSGNVQLFRDGQYVGATEWRPLSADRFVFSFGRDELVRVSVDPVKGRSGSVGIFERRSERHITDQITLTSAHKRPVDILLLESSPVSGSDEIKVKATFEPKPTTETWEKRQGVVAWETTLAPKASATFTVDYVIDYPREGRVSGMY